MVYESFILEHWYYYCTIIVEMKNMDFFKITCFKESKNRGVENNASDKSRIFWADQWQYRTH